MNDTLWFSRGTKLINDFTVNKLIASGQNWQIIISTYNKYLLAIKPLLYNKWITGNLIPDTLFLKYSFENNDYFLFFSKNDYIISSAEYGQFPNNITTAQSFSIALKETRKNYHDIPLHDSIFIEQLSKLLPTYTITESCSDDYLLGKWLSGGVNISVKNINRLLTLLNWMNKNDLISIIENSGLGIKIIKQVESNNEEKNIEKDKCFILKGRPELEKFFNEHIIDVINNNERYKRMGINFPSAIILHGPPGCGKTFAVEKLIDFLDLPNFHISSATIGSPYIHDTSKKISQIFDKAIEAAPSVLVIDEMEAFLSARNTNNPNGHHVEEVAEFLRRIPEANDKNVLIIAMTNMIDAIDNAILRRGRFDHILEVKMPSLIEIEELIASILNKIPHDKTINIKDISIKLQNRPLSDVAFSIKEACFYAAKNDIEFLNNELILNAISKLPPIKKTETKIGFGTN